MSNHLHIIIAGKKADVLGVFALFKERLRRYLSGQKRYCRMENFEADVFQIPDLQALRNEIVYVNRNGYLVHPECTPFSYWWSAGVFFFCPMEQMLPTKAYTALTLRERRLMCHSREAELPGHYQVLESFRPNGIDQAGPLLMATSFCAIREAEQFFLNAHHYFRQVSRGIEAFSEVARRLGDRIFLTDEELYGAVSAFCAKDYATVNPVLLTPEQKQEAARRMHFDYNATNKQIQRMLKLTPPQVEALFPQPVSER